MALILIRRHLYVSRVERKGRHNPKLKSRSAIQLHRAGMCTGVAVAEIGALFWVIL